MKAIVQDRYGSADVLQLREVPPPAPRRGEVLVRVEAAGLDRGTWHLMTGLPRIIRLGTGLRRPRNPVPGMALAGVVAEVGQGAAGFAVGDRVFGVGTGTFAEVARARADRLAHRPACLSAVEAAALPVSATTALQALRDVGRVQAGQSVLVVGASGGVGAYAVQLAKASGAEVTAVCSTTKIDLVRAAGADHVLDHTREDVDAHRRRYDLVLDIAGNRPVAQLRRVLTPTGTVVFIGGEHGGPWTGGIQRQVLASARSPFVRHRLAMFVSRESTADLQALAGLAGLGALRPVVDRTFPLAEAAKAMGHLEAGHARGKVVVVP
ncbi:NADPH:quinone reductase-like Zn-dependent oxidoreductase [Kineococcus xinjiangensis]|uniref:NADPH:quinone reductase-like Zn-dependent oxidoreductase n=1 Tax=Kineococcus xinjiangensis TaxID=512762 RepID=A0A2S6ISI7_9ACTN|nr:NAD(P)-dependent alcohol dehydrogenase [Kineococcus xinjiangensis]PPK97217.1 NADPH:quinone reductase-like Zn-dependent oxidoreductase [Kineococcus xinjiangensis]